MRTEWNTSGDACDVILADMAEWDQFAADNREGIEEAYGTIEMAIKHAIDGGLMLGGGAAPICHVSFEG